MNQQEVRKIKSQRYSWYNKWIKSCTNYHPNTLTDLCKSRSLTSLHLTNNFFECKEIKEFADALQKNSSLEDLLITDNNQLALKELRN
ncbi:hypothetical protein C2G38_2116591 [Gigaspora rosea]|uniref:Uncharacterized protein n=1 Tax=Gigaspora rosea TaxID=44941 RepID=A0A397U7L9_9GLOM|nr:hypothetical protein C2G38_2116591 [Gigaspora rosea]